MTLPSEVVRILAKDLRVLRWPLTAWAALLTLSVIRGLGAMPVLHEVLFPVAWIVPMMAAALVAFAVTADPATDGPTFWGVHRQRPLAVATAKATMALLLLAVMAGAHAVVLASHGLSAREMASLTADAAAPTGAWLLFGTALAACARNAKGWLVGIAMIGVLALLVTIIVADTPSAAAQWPLTRESAAVLVTLVSLAVLAWTYRAHLTGVRAGVRNALLMVIGAVGLVSPRESIADPTTTDRTRPDAALIVDTDRVAARIDRRAVVVDVPMTYPDSSVVSGLTVTWRLQLRDGSVINLLPNGARVRRGATLLKPEENAALWGRGPVSRTLEFRYPLDSATLARVEGNLSAVTLALQTNRVAMQRVASFSAAEGGTVTFEGGRLRIAPTTPDGRFATNVSWVAVPAGLSAMPWSASFIARPILALVAPDGRGARILVPSHDPAHEGTPRSPSWVLPGNTMGAVATTLVAAGDGAPTTGDVVALTGVYAGRMEQMIRAPFLP